MTGFYDCPNEVFEDIYKQIETLIIKNEKLTREKNEIEWIKELSKIDNMKKPVIISDFFLTINCNWEADSHNVFILFFNLMEGVTAKIAGQLFSEWDVMESNEKFSKIRVIENNVFESIYQKIYNNIRNAISKYNTSGIKKISLEDFHISTDLNSILDENQRYLYSKMNESLTLLKEFTVKLNKFVSSDVFFLKKNDRNKFMVVNPIDFRGKSVHQVFYYYIELFMQICGYFRESTTMMEIEQLKKLIEAIGKNEERLKNISDSGRHIEKLIREKRKTEINF